MIPEDYDHAELEICRQWALLGRRGFVFRNPAVILKAEIGESLLRSGWLPPTNDDEPTT